MLALRRPSVVALAALAGAAPACAGPGGNAGAPCAAHGAVAASEAPLGADPARLRDLAETRGYKLGAPRGAVPTPDGKRVLFLRSGPRTPRQTLFEMDLATGAAREVLTPEALAGAADEVLSPEERARRERMRVSARGFASFELDRRGERLVVSTHGRVFAVQVATWRGKEVGRGEDPRLSPDGSKIAFVRNHDLYVVPADGGAEIPVTRGGTEAVPHGEADFIAAEELARARGFWWSPDSSEVLYEEVDQRGVERLTIADPAHPEKAPDRPFYPRAGRANAEVRFGVVAAREGAPTRWLTWDRARYPYVATVRWDEGAPPALVVLDRAQQEMVLLAGDPRTGATRALVTERDDAYLNVEASVPRFLPGGQLAWSSERGGKAALELRDARTGALVRPLDLAGAELVELVHVDTRRGVAWALASDEPTRVWLYRVPLSGARATPEIAPPDGMVTKAELGDGDDVIVASVTGRTEMPRVLARRVDGGETRTVPSVADAPPELPRVELLDVGPEHTRVAVVRPKGFDPRRKYPVVDAAYAGPTANVVNASAFGYLRDQWLADAIPAVVVAIDAKGTPRRGRAWERAVRGNFGALAAEGHVEALRALAARDPSLDLARVGVVGWSFGGFYSGYAVLARPDVYKAGVAGAPVTEQRDYDTAYTERYLGLPDANPAAYDAASLVGLARRTKPAPGHALLVVHGTADDNVFFFHSLGFVDALARGGHAHELVPLPGTTHMLVDPGQAEAVWTRAARFLRRAL